jgi:hypothetical protein|tara:strand:- start:3552 stop:3740 length:189 start_codon:yes stop_codon:yes gene_type:complete
VVDIDVHDVDKRLSNVEVTLNRLENNHLSHIEKKIDKLDNRLWMLIMVVTVELVGIIGILLK